ncbi:amidohydrolase [Stakelama sediminis]|nr:amidohydrolase [Stakelama sediminis]
MCGATLAHADGLIDNVNGIALDRNGEVVHFTGLTIGQDGRITALLSDHDKRPKHPDWRTDMHGKTLIPGMVDAHGHVMELGLRKLSLDLSDTTSLAEAQAKLATFADKNQGRPWILGGGWTQESWGMSNFPTAADLDKAVSERPVWLTRADGHAGWANSAALKAADITAKTSEPKGGRIIRDAKGNPTGILIGTAQKLMEKVVPQPSPKDLDAAFQAAQEALLSVGITATDDMGTSVADWMAFRRAGDKGQLRLRIVSYADSVKTATLIAGPGPTPWLYDGKLRCIGIKYGEDGTLGTRGAWLKAPYADAPKDTGLPLLTTDQLLNLMSRASMDHFQVAVDAYGDKANQTVLDSIDELTETYKGDRRWRIEHAQIVDPDDLPRFGKHGIIASMEPVRAVSERAMATARLGPDRLKGAFAWNAMLANKVPLAFGSDYPVEEPNPFIGWAVAFTRQDADGRPFGGWTPEQAVSRVQAWRAFTQTGAYASFAEKDFGTLAPGEQADFLIVDRDPLLVSPTDLRQTQVLQTWVGGKPVWERKGNAQ